MWQFFATTGNQAYVFFVYDRLEANIYCSRILQYIFDMKIISGLCVLYANIRHVCARIYRIRAYN